MMQGYWDEPRYKIVIWKDSVLPYIKNGGRYMKPDGTAYTGSSDQNGGIFASPAYSGSWAPNGLDTPNSFGDATTRFPRSYALNGDAGINEGMATASHGGSQNNDDGIWPWVEYWSWETPQNKGGSGNLTALEMPANTIQVSGTRVPWPNTGAFSLSYACDSTGSGCDVVNPNVTQARGVGNAQLNLAFFDGHAKSMKGTQSVATDAWGRFKNYPNDQATLLGYMRGNKEWTP